MAVRVLDDERVQAVLLLQRLDDAAVVGQHADPAERPVQGVALLHERVQVHRLVSAVEPADPQVDDAHPQCGAVVAGDGDSVVDPGETLLTQGDAHGRTRRLRLSGAAGAGTVVPLDGRLRPWSLR